VLLRVGSEVGGDFSGDIACDDGDAGSSALGRPEGSSRRRHALQVWLTKGVIISARCIFGRKMERRFTKGTQIVMDRL